MEGDLVRLPDTFSDQDGFYQDADFVMTSGMTAGQRRKVTAYFGSTRTCKFVGILEGAEIGDSFYMRALRVQRGQKSTGPTEVFGGEAITLGQIHARDTPVYFTNSTWTVLKDSGTWTRQSGTLVLSTMADADPYKVIMFSFAVTNPPGVQDGATVHVTGSGVNLPTTVLTVDPYKEVWPITETLVVCHAGTWLDPGEVTCTDCAIGKFSTYCGGLRNCSACAPTTYTAEVRQTTCLQCDEGFFCVGNANRQPCSQGTFSEAGQSACTNCTIGYYCPGQLGRIKCPRGMHMPRTGASVCDACSPGEFQILTGATHCDVCGNGTFSPAPGAEQCTQCGAGTWAVGTAQTGCSDCPVDEFQDRSGQTSCAACPANSGARLVMGLCRGACGGSGSKTECLCKPGFTRFGVTSDACVAYRFTLAQVGQSSACASKLNTIGVTMATNVPLSTGVQAVGILAGGMGYADATIDVLEATGKDFRGRAGVTDGVITSVLIEAEGRYYRGSPDDVLVYFAPGCALDDSGCTKTLQAGSVATVRIASPGIGYTPGTLRLSGGGGVGAAASFLTDANGAVSSVVFEAAEHHGVGYSGVVTVELLYTGNTRCDTGEGALRSSCEQKGTITALRRASGTISSCDTAIRIVGTGGGGSGFEAQVLDINAFGSIVAWRIDNHGANYISAPSLHVTSGYCTCNGVMGTTPGAFDACLVPARADGAVLEAVGAGGAQLAASSGSVLVASGFGSALLLPRAQVSGRVRVLSAGSVSISAGESQTCGVMANGTAICWGKSEAHYTFIGSADEDIEVWRCGYSARLYRFRALVVRGGHPTANGVGIGELELFGRDGYKLVASKLSNPDGANPAGYIPELAADGDVETKWEDSHGGELVLDMGAAVAVEAYRWSTAATKPEQDPVAWVLEASNDGARWVVVHERTETWNGEYSVDGYVDTRTNKTVYPRLTYSRHFRGACSIPLGQAWRGISSSAFHHCGVNGAGVGLCWGHNNWGQLKFPDTECTCLEAYKSYCDCTSANFESYVHRKISIQSTPTQCDAAGRCVNLQASGTCLSAGCQYIYDNARCRLAGIQMNFISAAAPLLADQRIAVFPKGCYWLSDAQLTDRLKFNKLNATDFCTATHNCLCKDCPRFRFVPHASLRYCAGTFDIPDAQLVGATTVEQCEVACGADEACDFFTFYPASSSVPCAPCCFKKSGDCDLIDPTRVLPAVGGSKASALWSVVSAGHLHTCGVTMSGALRCWGFNRDGQSDVPMASRDRAWKSVSAARYHSCGVLDDLTVQCWGAPSGSPFNVGQIAPTPGRGALKWRAVSTAAWSTCGVTEQGAALCWGCGAPDTLGRSRGVSALGDVNKGQCKVPADVDEWDSVATAEYHSCGVTANGEIRCWGCRCAPARCPSFDSPDVDFGQCDVPSGRVWSTVSVGKYHTCGLDVRGQAVCWGGVRSETALFFQESGTLAAQPPGEGRKYDLGQALVPTGVAEWLNPRAFVSEAVWTEGTLRLPTQGSTLVGADYFFAFQVKNPPVPQDPALAELHAEGVSVAAKPLVHASDALAALRVVGCAEGTRTGASDEEVCRPCEAGTYAVDCGVSSCTACHPGTFSSSGQAACDACPMGTFALDYGSTWCTACPAGTAGPAMGAVSRHDGCLDCAQGNFSEVWSTWEPRIGAWVEMQATTCTVCPPGHYCEGASDKQRCPSGTFQPSFGVSSAAACEVCPHQDRCTGDWPRYICNAPSGVANGTVYTELTHCERACFEVDRRRGVCEPAPFPNNGCVEGYTGYLCGACYEGFHPDTLDFKCKPCEAGTTRTGTGTWLEVVGLITYTGAILIVPLVCDLFYFDWRAAVYVRIMFSFLQVQDLTLAVDINWPPFLFSFVRWLRVFGFDLMFTNPFCFVEASPESWRALFLIELAIPVAVALGILSLASFADRVAALYAHIRWWLRKRRSAREWRQPWYPRQARPAPIVAEDAGPGGASTEALAPVDKALAAGTFDAAPFDSPTAEEQKTSGRGDYPAEEEIPPLDNVLSRALWRLLGHWLVWNLVPVLGTLLRALHCSCVPLGYELHRPSWNNCSAPGVRSVLTANPYVECQDEDGVHGPAAALAALGLSLILVGIPAAALVLPDIHHREISRFGWLRLVNVGVRKGDQVATGVSPGSGAVQVLQEELENMLELVGDGSEELARLEHAETELRRQARKKEVAAIVVALQRTDGWVSAAAERASLLESRQVALQKSQRPGGRGAEACEVASKRQLQAIAAARRCMRDQFINFVQPIDVQRRRLKEARRELLRLGGLTGHGWLKHTHAVRVFTAAHEWVVKTGKKTDAIRAGLLSAGFWAASITLAPTALLVAVAMRAVEILRARHPITDFVHVETHWANYGERREVTGQVIRVDPPYGQLDEPRNAAALRGKIAVVLRGRGTQHESSAVKARRLQAIGVLAVVVVNDGIGTFEPNIVTENLAAVDAIDIPVVSIAQTDLHLLAENAVATLAFRKDWPRLFGLHRVRTMIASSVMLSSLIEGFDENKQWFQVIELVRRVVLALCRSLPSHYPRLQASSILFANFCYTMATLYCPFKCDDLNRMEIASAASTLATAAMVAVAANLFGENTQGVPGLEPKGSAGTEEDHARMVLFLALAIGLVVTLSAGALFLVGPLLELFAARVACAVRALLPRRPQADEPPDPAPQPPEPPVAPLFDSTLHATTELFRVLPASSICESALQAALSATRVQLEVQELRVRTSREAIRRRPWVALAGEGALGFYAGKSVVCFLHRLTGVVIEIPGASPGEVRFKVTRDGYTKAFGADGVVVPRDAFYAPHLVRALEAGAALPPWPPFQRSALCAPDRLAQVGATDALRLDLCPSLLDRWHVQAFCPLIRICHRTKLAVEIWLTRSGAILLGPEDRAVTVCVHSSPPLCSSYKFTGIGQQGQVRPVPCANEGHREEAVARQKALELLEIEAPGFLSAVGAVTAAQGVRLQRRAQPRWLAMCRYGRDGLRRPVSALEAIMQGLEAESAELWQSVGTGLEVKNPMVPSGPSSASTPPGEGFESGRERQKGANGNPSVIAWRRPGQVRRSAVYDGDKTGLQEPNGVAGTDLTGAASGRNGDIASGTSELNGTGERGQQLQEAVEGLMSHEEAVRAQGLKTLLASRRGGGEAVTLLLEGLVLEGPLPETRLAGARTFAALAEAGDESVVEALSSAMVLEEDDTVREELLRALARLDPK